MTDPAADPSPRARWDAAAAAVLRKAGRLPEGAPDADAWARLARTTVEGLTVPPLGTLDDAAALPTTAALASAPGVAPYLRGGAGIGGWDVRTLIDDPHQANAVALAELMGGGNSLWLRLGAGGIPVAALAEVLAGVYLEAAPLVLSGTDDDLLAAAEVLATLQPGNDPFAAASSLGADPLGAAVRDGTTADLGRIPALARSARELGIGALVVDGTAVHEAGSGDAQEVGYTLAAGAAYLRALTAAGLDIDAACALVGFRYAVTDDQFGSIAKLRAARLGWHRLTQLCGASTPVRAQYQHAVTSTAMMTRYDRYVNLLRCTVAAFAAGVGGAQAVTVLPFAEPDEFSRRMARNISVLLTGESHVDAVADPAGGAYAVERLTSDLAEAAWAEFGRIEADGGIAAALEDGSLAARIAQTRADRDRRIAKRSWPITGVSEFPLAGEQPAPAAKTGYHWAAPFEALRDDPAPAPLALVRLGSQAASSPRFSFAENLLTAGGVPLSVIAGPASPDDGVDLEAALRTSGCPAVLFAGADADYAALLSPAVEAARTAGMRTVFLAGRPKALLSEWPEGWVDGTVAMGDDVLVFLDAVRGAVSGGREEALR